VTINKRAPLNIPQLVHFSKTLRRDGANGAAFDPGVFNANAWRLFDAAVLWAARMEETADPSGPIVLSVVGRDEAVASYDNSAPIVVGPDTSGTYMYAVFTEPLQPDERKLVEAQGCKIVRTVSSQSAAEVHEIIALNEVNALAQTLQAATTKFLNIVPKTISEKITWSPVPVVQGSLTRVTIRCGDHVDWAQCRDTIEGRADVEGFYRSYFVGFAGPEQIQALAESPWIESIVQVSETAVTLDQARSLTRVDAAQGFTDFPVFPTTPLSGGGILIGIYDTGIDPTHSAFYWPNTLNLRKVEDQDWFEPKVQFRDSDGRRQHNPHGTHVAGIAAGGGQHFPGGGFDNRGVAPGATIYSAETAFLGPKERGNVVNHSHIARHSDVYDGHDLEMDAALHAPWTYEDQTFKTMVVGAGNQGFKNDRQSRQRGYYSVLNESKNAIVVGNLDGATKIIDVSSSQGPTRDGRIKPDLVAPGTHIMSTGFASFDYCQLENAGCNFPTEDRSGIPRFYYEASGTSMATPHVSGVAALMHQVARDRHPGCVAPGLCEAYAGDALRNATIKAIMIQTAEDLMHTEQEAVRLKTPSNPDLTKTEGKESYGFYGPGPDFSTGWGLIDAKASIEAVSNRNYLEEYDLTNGEERRYQFEYAGTDLRVTVVWDDEAASTLDKADANNLSDAQARRLVNDIDIYLIDPLGERHYPWTLDPFLDNGFPVPSSGLDNISRKDVSEHQAERAPGTNPVDDIDNYDHRNNVERVDVEFPYSGTWTLVVRGRRIGSKQDFSIAHPGALIQNAATTVVYRARTSNDGRRDWKIQGEAAGMDRQGDALVGVTLDSRGTGAGALRLEGRQRHDTGLGFDSDWGLWLPEGTELLSHSRLPITQLALRVSQPQWEGLNWDVEYRVMENGLWSAYVCGGTTAGTPRVHLQAVEVRLRSSATGTACP